MKKKLLPVIIAFAASIPGLQAGAQQPIEAYAALNSNTLTFYDDGQRSDHEESTYDIPQNSSRSDQPSCGA